ncbi:MAG TPA: ATP-binding protein [Aliidongia sp.]|nr:ATP-binding protein [Aliidongia sp.]
MWSRIVDFFDDSGLNPHGFCLLWQPDILAANVLADALITLSYFTIPAALFVFAWRRPDFQIGKMAGLFAAFIVLCGVTHLFSIITLWQPIYGVEAVLKLLTAAASILTAFSFWRVLPRLLRVPSASQLAEVNARLASEIVTRRAAEMAMRDLNAELDERTRVRTIELEESYDRLADALGHANRAEGRERQAQRRLADAIEALPVGVTIFDTAGRLVLANGECRDLNQDIPQLLAPGVQFEALLRGSARNILFRDQASRETFIAQRLEALAKTGVPVEAQLVDGRWVRIEDRATQAGETVGLMMDITEARQREAALMHALAAAEAASEAKTQFLANMSHELRTPLNAVIGFAEIMNEGLFGPLSEQYAGYARDIKSSGQHLLKLVNNILDLAKIESGNCVLREETVDLELMVRNCATVIGLRLKERNISLQLEIEDLPMVSVDPLRMRQAILSLLSNAAKFTEPGGRVWVSAARGSGGIEIKIADSGIGMSEQEIAAALEPFRQVEGALNRRFEGSGLGLPLALAYVELHGGALRIESRKSIGTTVTISLPGSRIVPLRASANVG